MTKNDTQNQALVIYVWFIPVCIILGIALANNRQSADYFFLTYATG